MKDIEQFRHIKVVIQKLFSFRYLKKLLLDKLDTLRI